MRKVKIGDKCRILSTDGSGVNDEYIGKCGMVVDILLPEAWPYIRFPDGNTGCFRTSQYKIVSIEYHLNVIKKEIKRVKSLAK